MHLQCCATEDVCTYYATEDVCTYCATEDVRTYCVAEDVCTYCVTEDVCTYCTTENLCTYCATAAAARTAFQFMTEVTTRALFWARFAASICRLTSPPVTERFSFSSSPTAGWRAVASTSLGRLSASVSHQHFYQSFQTKLNRLNKNFIISRCVYPN